MDNGKTGFLVPPRSPEALADAINKLMIDSRLRVKMGEEGRKKAEKEYDWDLIVRKYLKIYNSFLKNLTKIYS